MKNRKKRKMAEIDQDFDVRAREWDLSTGGNGLSMRRITRKIKNELIDEQFLKKRKGLNESFKW